MLDKGDVHTVLLPQMQEKSVSLTPWGQSYYLNATVSQHRAAAAAQYYIVYARKRCLSDSCLRELLLLVVWWPCLNHPNMDHNCSVEEGTAFFNKGSSSAS